MRNLLLTTLLSFSLTQTGQQPIVVPIQNPSFEQGTLGWHFGPSSGVMRLGDVPVAYAGYGGTFSQDLGISPKAVQKASTGWPDGTEGTYTLTFEVLNYFPNYPGKFNAEIDFGTQELCETYGWATSRWSQVTLSCPSSNYLVLAKAMPGGGAAQGSQNFVLHFTVNDGSPNGGWTVMFKQVSLTFQGDTQ